MDRLQQAEDALQSALAQEHERRVDAEAWRLLHETLAAAENEESDPLGAALGRPVGDKLIELTGGRYRDLGFDQHLTPKSSSSPAAPKTTSTNSSSPPPTPSSTEQEACYAP